MVESRPFLDNKTNKLSKIIKMSSVIAIVTVNDPARAVNIAHALVKGGLPVIEITLRTQGALDCIAAVTAQVSGAVVGAGTVIGSSQILAVEKAGAKFMISPGSSLRLLDACDDSSLPMLPGIATPSEAMKLGERGYSILKFYPAKYSGGTKFLRTIFAPMPQFQFCPTGDLNEADAREYLQLPNVACVGGSWMLPENLVSANDWNGITALASRASQLRPLHNI